MKRYMLGLLIIALLLMASVPVLKLMRLEVINKSNQPAYLKLNEINWDAPASYYLNIPAGASLPAVKLFTIVRGVYDVEASYCDMEFVTLFANLDLNKAQFRITIPPCNLKAEASGDGLLKLNPWLYPPVDEYDVQIIHDLGGFNYRY